MSTVGFSIGREITSRYTQGSGVDPRYNRQPGEPGSWENPFVVYSEEASDVLGQEGSKAPINVNTKIKEQLPPVV